MAKYFNEITVIVTDTKEQALHKLLNQGYQIIEQFLIEDSYYLPKDYVAKDTLDVLNHCILIRKFGNRYKLTYKHKECDDKGIILNQQNYDVQITNPEDAKAFLTALNYENILVLHDDIIIMKKDNLGIVLQDVNEGEYFMLEMEENEYYLGIDTLITNLNETGIHYDSSDYYVKKAQLLLEKRKMNG